jgi:uncharacterized membrane protein YphA (DoxX/SURF4 family)
MSSPAIALVATPPDPSPSQETITWSPARRFVFRFTFAYVALYSFGLAANSEFGWDWLTLVKLWHAVVPWLGKHVLHLAQPITTFTNGSGDTTYDWTLAGLWAVMALVAAAVWSIVDRAWRRQPNHERLLAALRVWVRYALAYQMLSYGFAKVFKLQFLAPGPSRLLETYGESSPMGLLWTFMGASTPYTIFGGAAEVLGGALLLFRRTATLGALVVVAVMTNVVMLNFCYDVPVKLLSTHLLLFALWLLAPELGRLADFFVRHRPTQPALRVWRPSSRRGVWARRIVKYGVIALITYQFVGRSIHGLRAFGDHAPKPPSYGAYEVEEFTRGGKVVAQKLGDPKRWRGVGIGRMGGTVQLADGTSQTFGLPENGRIEQWTDDPEHHYMSFAMPDAEHIILSGRFVPLDDEVTVKLKRADDSNFLLTKRGFHLINEFPLNR